MANLILKEGKQFLTVDHMVHPFNVKADNFNATHDNQKDKVRDLELSTSSMTRSTGIQIHTAEVNNCKF